MITAYSYVRFSSKIQELGSSLSRQVNLAKEYAAKNNLYLDNRSFRDLGISAFKGKNSDDGALGAFLKAVDDGIIAKGSYLLVESLDRVSRTNPMQALGIFTSIINRDIVLVTLFDKQVYNTANITENWTMLIGALMSMARAHEESAVKAKRIQTAWDSKRTKGKILTGMGPGWLKLNKEKQEWELLEDKINIVKRVFELAYSGLGAPSIARKLNDEGCPVMSAGKEVKEPADGSPPKEEKFTWSAGDVAMMMKNSSVIGRYTPKKAKAEPIDGYYPEVILPDVFYTVQENIAKRRGTGGRKGATIANLFSGMFRCECGSKVRYVSSAKEHYYLRCLSAYSNTGCDAPTIPYNVIEEQLLFYICHLEIADLKIGKADMPDPTVELRGEIAEKKKGLERMMGVIEGGGVVSRTIGARIVEIEGEIDALEKKLKDSRPAVPMTDALKATHLLYLQLKGESKLVWTDHAPNLPDDYESTLSRMRKAVADKQYEIIESRKIMRNGEQTTKLRDELQVLNNTLDAYEEQHPHSVQEVQELGAPAKGDDLQTIRAQMQAALRRVINKIVLLKALHVKEEIPASSEMRWNSKTKKDDREVFHAAEPRRESRQFVMYGPLIEQLKETSILGEDFKDQLTPDDGLPFGYTLPGWGINGTRRRSKSKAT